ncbi:coiled-coil domain-containing protein [Tenacibaculum amylolyticum]|uniref:hypothetical protein n=1 Tax=Tenacibaculum amylolyticum TaxID=104269 RepID=UPI00389581B8
MKFLKIIIPALTLFITGVQQINAQEVSREDKKKIKVQEEEIRANEEMLMSGVKGLERIKARLEKDKAKNRLTPKELERKSKIIRSVETRLDRLNTKIAEQKKELNTFKKGLHIKVEKTVVASGGTQSVVDEEKAQEINERALKLKAAREKLAKEIKESEAAYLKQQKELREKNLALAKLDSELKQEEKAIEGGEKLSEKNKQKIKDYEVEISMTQEMAASVREDLNNKKQKVATAVAAGKLSKVGLQRRKSIIRKIEKKLNKMEREIEKKKEAIQKLKGA